MYIYMYIYIYISIYLYIYLYVLQRLLKDNNELHLVYIYTVYIPYDDKNSPKVEGYQFKHTN